MKYFILAGEPSGDEYAANLANAIRMKDTHAEIVGVGGKYMQNAGIELLFGLDRLAFMGFVEVAKHLFTIRRNFKEIKSYLLQYKPDVVILVDYPGFNLRMAKWCKLIGFKVVYYISPKIWAWKESRVEVIKKYVDKMLCIFPFELDFYKKHGYTNALYVGNPLIKKGLELKDEYQTNNAIALLPGSRKQEIKRLMPVFIELAQLCSDKQFIIAAMSRLKDEYQAFIPLPQNMQLVFDNTENVLNTAALAVVCSGTATLQTALLNIPQVVVYRTSFINYQIGKRLAKVNYISLPNLIINREIIKELLQQDCTAANILTEIKKIEAGFNFEAYAQLRNILQTGNAAENAATEILKTINK